MRGARAALWVVYTGVVTVALLELGVRVWGYSGRFIYDPIYAPFPGSSEIPFVLKPNVANARGHGFSIVNTDSLGLRSVETGRTYPPKAPGEYRIAVVGDSVTFGVGLLSAADTYSAKLERLLREGDPPRNVRVFNFGVGSYSVREMAATVEHRMVEVDPDLVIMAVIYADFETSRTPSIDSLGYFDDTKRSGTALQNSVLKRWLRNFHLAYVLRDLRYAYTSRNYSQGHVGLPESYDYVLRFHRSAEAMGVAQLFLILPNPPIPAPGLLDNLAILRDQLDKDGVPYADVFSVRDEFSLEDFRASRFDDHPSPAVHQRIAEELAREIRARHLLPQP